jgi:two-component system, OmpR family, phosphate regulon response regulator OmpR
VEDDPSIRGVIREALRDDGYRVLEARHGCEAIRAINEQTASAERPCLVLLDLMLAGTDGLRVLQQLAAAGGRVPVVAMSASRQHLRAAQTAGTDAVLPKPFDPGRLVGVVRSYCPPPS